MHAHHDADPAVEAARGTDLVAQCGVAAVLLPGLHWPPPSKFAPAGTAGAASGGDGGGGALSLAATLTPSQAVKKVQFLQVLLS